MSERSLLTAAPWGSYKPPSWGRGLGTGAPGSAGGTGAGVPSFPLPGWRVGVTQHAVAAGCGTCSYAFGCWLYGHIVQRGAACPCSSRPVEEETRPPRGESVPCCLEKQQHEVNGALVTAFRFSAVAPLLRSERLR